jgi:hypothetical protein
MTLYGIVPWARVILLILGGAGVVAGARLMVRRPAPVPGTAS